MSALVLGPGFVLLTLVSCTSVVGATSIVRSLHRLACRVVLAAWALDRLGAGRRRRSFLLRGLKRVEASLDRAKTAVEWIDRPQLRRDVVAPPGKAVHRANDDAMRDGDESPEGVLAHVSEFRDGVVVSGPPYASARVGHLACGRGPLRP